MAKGQMRGNREIRKPKKDKSAVKEMEQNPSLGHFPALKKETLKNKK